MFARRLFLIVCFACLGGLVSGCGDEDSTESRDACVGDFECGLGFECGADGYCVEITEGNNGQADAGPTDTGGEEQDTGGEERDTGGEEQDTGTTDTGTTDTGATDTGTTDTGTTDTGATDTGTTDTGTTDTGTTDTGTTDTGTTDTGTTDTGTTDTGTTDTGTADSGTADSGTADSGTSIYSGCTTDLDCDSYQSCNTNLGRCEEARSSCTDDTQCGFGELCYDGRCASECTSTGTGTDTCGTGLTCVTDGNDSVCLALCDGLPASSGQCSPDTQCIPYGGVDLGLCRGVGEGDVGDTCTGDFSAGDCQSGSYCVDRRGELTCESMCGANGSPACGTDEFCLDLFTNDDPSLNAGVCLTNCGGLGSVDDTLCTTTGQSCQPLNSSEGYCTPQGTNLEGESCTFDGTTYCETGTTCLPTGADAATTPTQGVCASYCDPAAATSASTCGVGDACFQLGDDPNFGLCEGQCDPSLLASANSCTTERPRCLPFSGATNATEAGNCAASGSLATGAGCDLESPLECNANALCVVPNDDTEPFGGSSSGAGNCADYCLTNDFGSTTSRCDAGEVCAARYITLGLGFCTTNTTATTMAPGTACSTSELGQWCDDNTLCLDWFESGTTQHCEIPCYTDVPGTCPSSMTCNALASGDTFGICQ